MMMMMMIIYLYHRSLKVNFNLQNVYSAFAAYILTAVPNPPNIQLTLHKQHNICHHHVCSKALRFCCMENFDRAKHVAFIQGTNFDAYQIPASRAVKANWNNDCAVHSEAVYISDVTHC